MKLRSRILAGYTTSSLLILGLGVAILFTINTVSPIVDELEREVTALGRAVSLSGLSGRIVSLRTELSRTAYQFVLAQDIAYERRYERASRELSEVFEQAIKKSDSEDDATIFRNLRGTSLKLGISERGMINLARAKKIEQAKALAQSEDYVELNAAISDFVAKLANRKQVHSSDIFSRLIDVSAATQTNRKKLNTLARITTVSVVLILIASLLVGAFISRSISRPLTLLKEGAVAVGKGDLDHRIEVERSDELGELALAFNSMGERRQQAEEALQSSLREKELLLNEVNHRVKNNLQIISLLLRMSGRRTDSTKAQEVIQDCDSRIHTMGLIHSELYQSGNFEQIDLGHIAQKLLNHLLQVYKQEGTHVRPLVQAEDVSIPLSHAVPCALVLNELLTNVLKHAFVGRSVGTVEVHIGENADGWVRVVVQDDGVGMPEDVDPLETESLGLLLVRDLVLDQLHGKVEVDEDKGTVFCVEFPLVKEGSDV